MDFDFTEAKSNLVIELKKDFNRIERQTLKWRRKIVTCLKEKLLFLIRVRYSPKKTAEKSGTMTELTQKKFLYSAKKFLHRRERQHKKRRKKIRNICYICNF